jgi:hypothetical protein
MRPHFCATVVCSFSAARTSATGTVATAALSCRPAQRAVLRSPSLAQPRYKVLDAVVTMPSGAVLVAGGAAVVQRLARGRFISAGRVDKARYFSAATLLRNGAVLVVGGFDESITPTARSFLYRP